MIKQLALDIKKRARDDPSLRRAQILDEAIRIIGERGYYGFALLELAQRCGLTNGGLLYHFNSKEALLFAVIEEYERRIEAALAPLLAAIPETDLASDTTPLPHGLNLLRAIFEKAVSEPELARLYAVLETEAMHPSHPAHAHFSARLQQYMDLILRTVTSNSAEPQSTARHILAVIDGLTLQWLRTDFSFDILSEWDRAMARILAEGEVK